MLQPTKLVPLLNLSLDYVITINRLVCHSISKTQATTKMFSSTFFAFSFICIFSLPFFSLVALAIVPVSERFQAINEGEFGPYINEYDADYRNIRFGSPFNLVFYNTTPNAYTLALRMGSSFANSGYQFVWEANRGKPVRENATLTLGADGNLILAEADRTVVWQTNTANKGVVGFRRLPNGNMVLYDSKGKFVWQSFDYPTDTILVGQSLKVGGVSNLVSRLSRETNANGPYSLTLEGKKAVLSYKSVNSKNPLVYYKSRDSNEKVKNTTLNIEPDYFPGVYELTFSPLIYIIVRTRYNSTLTYLRLQRDGNIKLITFDARVDYSAWDYNTFNLFANRDPSTEPGCDLPERCGKFGVCEDDQCVACPSPSGLLGWSKDCKPPKGNFCGVKDFKYYKIDGVDHFMSRYNKGLGPIKEMDCGVKCSNDCKCLGYFYHKETSKCWIANELFTLTKFPNSTHYGYVKIPK